MGQISTSETSALGGVKVPDRSILILKSAIETPRTLVEFCKNTNLPRATAHRLATTLKVHRLVIRTPDGRWTTGPGLTEITPITTDLLADATAHILPKLIEVADEPVQLCRLTGNAHTCIASVEPATGLRNTVPVGSHMPLTAGSAAYVLLAFSPVSLAERMLSDADLDQQDLDDYRRLGWSEPMGGRDPAFASVSAPTFDGSQRIIAVLSASGPVERTTPSPYKCQNAEALAAAEEMSSRL